MEKKKKRTLPRIEDNVLTILDTEDTRPGIKGRIIQQIDLTDPNHWRDWQQFLEEETAFRYIYTDPKQKYKFSFSGRKEMRKQWGTRGKEYAPQPYWYAHKYVNNKLRRKYLGVPRNLTAKKLQQVVMEIAQGKLV